MQHCILDIHWVFHRQLQRLYVGLFLYLQHNLVSFALCSKKGDILTFFQLIKYNKEVYFQPSIFLHFLPSVSVFTHSLSSPNNYFILLLKYHFLVKVLLTAPSRAGFLILSTTDILVWIILWCGRLSCTTWHLPARCQ